jgi:hypothetical protein
LCSLRGNVIIFFTLIHGWFSRKFSSKKFNIFLKKNQTFKGSFSSKKQILKNLQKLLSMDEIDGGTSSFGQHATLSNDIIRIVGEVSLSKAMKF